MRRRAHLPVALMLSGLAACGGGGTDPDLSVEATGDHGVGTLRTIFVDDTRQRSLTVQAWYPAEAGAGAAGVPIEDLEAEPHRSSYAGMLAQASAACPTRTAHAVPDAGATPAAGTFPLIVFSHCHECTRYSGLSIAERLASHGFVVIAVDHAGNTLWDRIEGTPLPLDTTTLELRAADLAFVAQQARIDSPVANMLAPARTGAFGHSFGSVTAGLFTQRGGADAVFGLAAPMENPLLAGVTVASIAAPIGLLVAREDNSVGELGNELIRGNFLMATSPAWKIEVADAGHWSVSDVVGLQPAFAAGCGDGVRQTDGQPFTYLDPATGRDLAAAYVTAFFKATLEGDAGAEAYLETARPMPTVTVEHR